jgi:RNA polymerase sigma-70 factor (ECF subfamily)
MAANDARQSAEERIARWAGEHGRAVRGYVFGLVRRTDVADDLVQEVFQRAWQARDRYRDQGHERAYLLRIADRLVIDRGRRRKLEVNVDEATWHEVEPADRTDQAFEEVTRGETSDELMTALDQLSTAQTRVLLLRFFGDLTFEEIADTLDCPLSTVLSHCRRGLAVLRQLLAAKQT